MRKVEPQVFTVDQRSLLLHMRAQHFAQRRMHQVRSGMVGSSPEPFCRIHHRLYRLLDGLRQARGIMDDQFVFFFGIHHLDHFIAEIQFACIAHLAAAFSIEWRFFQHQLVIRFALCRNTAVFQHFGHDVQVIISHKLYRFILDHRPVCRVNSGSRTAPVLLLLHFRFKTWFIYAKPVFLGNQPRQVDREAISVKQFKCCFAIDAARCGRSGNDVINAFQPFVQRTQESVFFFLHHFAHEINLLVQLGEYMLKLLCQHRDQLIQQGLFITEVGIIITHRPAQNAAYDIASAGVGRQLPVGNGKTNGADMVGNNTKGNGLFAVAKIILPAGEFFGGGNGTGKHIGVVVAFLALDYPHQAFKTHTGIHVPGGQVFE